MGDKKVTIEVLQANSDDPDYAHIVRITVHEGETQIRQADIPGGGFENAKGMAEGLVRYINAGGDIMKLLPDG